MIMTDELKYKPTGYSYRVDENVWAGEYPVWGWDYATRRQQLQLYTDFGIGYFVDLAEEGEMPPYAPMLPSNVGRYTFPIPNRGVPESVQGVVELMHRVEDALGQGKKVYIHCVGGVGRTGMIVACYYVYFRQMSADEAMAEMRRRFATHGRSAWCSAPETEAQIGFVKEFADNFQ